MIAQLGLRYNFCDLWYFTNPLMKEVKAGQQKSTITTNNSNILLLPQKSSTVMMNGNERYSFSFQEGS